MGRILIVFDSKGGSSAEIVQWIREGAVSKGAQVDVCKPEEVRSLDYDLITVGTPMYNDKPMESILNFLGWNGLSNKKVALFIVCFAGIFGMRNFMVRKYLEELKGACRGKVVKMTSFDSAKGPWRKVNRAVCIDFGKELASLSYMAVETT
ncbi:flavodoxin domain-containing protein [Methanocella conradii]|uniref:flavodoxin domain-containing protein n=1 Tax=Methanocella conradii TaxID=1175444 RepID=UPI00157DCB83|nr:flavodoxin domain-containing protein [Methanocella conradii]